MIPLRDVIPSRTTPSVTLLLIAAQCLLFAIAWLQPRDVFIDLVARFGMTPSSATVWTATTALFIHENLVHVGANALALWLFGPSVEDRLGHGRFLILFFTAGYAGALAEIWAAPGSALPVFGANGAVAGVIGAHLWLFPRSRLLVLIPVDLVEVPAVAFAASWFVLQVIGGLGRLATLQAGGLVLWTAVGGCLAGLILARLLRRRERMAVEWWS